MNQANDSDDRQRDRGYLAGMRAVWAALMLGQLFFAGVLLAKVQAQQLTPPPTSPTLTGRDAATLWRAAVVALVVAVLLGSFLRSQIYKRNWRRHAITPRGYFIGNLVLWIMLEVVFFFSIVGAMLTARIFPVGMTAIAAMLVMIVTFPTGKPLQPHPPAFNTPFDH